MTKATNLSAAATRLGEEHAIRTRLALGDTSPIVLVPCNHQCYAPILCVIFCCSPCNIFLDSDQFRFKLELNQVRIKLELNPHASAVAQFFA